MPETVAEPSAPRLVTCPGCSKPVHDPGDEHRDRPFPLHLASPERNAAFGRHNNANALGAVVRCGDFVPLHWVTSSLVLVDCPSCRDAVAY